MFGLFSLPGRFVGFFIGLCVWLFTRPGGWAVVCCLAIALTWYI
ncbi:hypothetical protein [Celeribacter arenosi]